MNHIAYIALGSNVGDRLHNLSEAIVMLKDHTNISLVSSSSIYETAPVGYTEQADFLNMVVLVKTNLTAYELLDVCLKIELELGRKREIKWGPRTIDLDILLYNQENMETEKLIVPHPRMHERAFVLAPLLEITPTLSHPNMEQSFQFFLDHNSDKEGVHIWKRKDGEGVFALFAN